MVTDIFEEPPQIAEDDPRYKSVEFELIGEGEEIDQGRSLWRAQDWLKKEDPKSETPFYHVQTHREADRWNEDKWGIYWTINQLKPGPRRNENLIKILSWAADCDSGTKESQQETIRALGLIPSLVVESKRGYQPYYDAIDADPADYNKFIDGLAVVFNSDRNVKGFVRLLRCPFYWHWKDKDDPYAVSLKEMNDIKYTQREMEKALRRFFDKRESKFFANAKEIKHSYASPWFEKMGKINCVDALTKLSGTEAVNYEKYSFHDQRNGKISVIVNGQSANVWIDNNGKIGSGDKGGPTIYQWLKWFGHNHEKIKEIIEDIYGEL